MKTLSISICFLALPVFANAQVDFVRAYGFLTVAPTNASSTPESTGFLPTPSSVATTPASTTYYGGGGGVEVRLAHGGALQRAGIGFDLSTLFPSTGKTWSEATANVGVNGYYHPWSSDTFDVFVTGGYAGMFRGVTANGFNAGGGVNIWFGGGPLGGTVELRELIFSNSAALPAAHYTEIRFGFAYRWK